MTYYLLLTDYPSHKVVSKLQEHFLDFSKIVDLGNLLDEI